MNQSVWGSLLQRINTDTVYVVVGDSGKDSRMYVYIVKSATCQIL